MTQSVTQLFKIGDRVRLRGGVESGHVAATGVFATGEPCYYVEPYLPGSGRMYVGETALEPAGAVPPGAEAPPEVPEKPKPARRRSAKAKAKASPEVEADGKVEAEGENEAGRDG